MRVTERAEIYKGVYRPYKPRTKKIKTSSREQNGDVRLKIKTESESEQDARELVRKISTAIHKAERRAGMKISYKISCRFDH